MNLCHCQVCQLSARLRRIESIVYTRQLLARLTPAALQHNLAFYRHDRAAWRGV
jgi:hypothetical protein